MELSLPKKKLNTMDPLPSPSQKESLNTIYNPNMQRPSCLFVPQPLENNCCSQKSILKRCTINLLNKTLKDLLYEKLARQIAKGRPLESITFHQKQLVQEVANWMGVVNTEEIDFDETDRDELLSVLVTACKQNVKEIPLDIAEWTKLLNQWLKVNTCGEIISNRKIYKILAVDGFLGYTPKCLKHYLPGVLRQLRNEYKYHFCGVKKMYDYFETCESISSLTGTDSACVIFLALLEWYQTKKECKLDDQIKYQIQQAKLRALGYLQQHGEYYRDVKNVDECILENLGKLYAEEFKEDSWKTVGRELMANCKVE